jgi:hypothetical protein
VLANTGHPQPVSRIGPLCDIQKVIMGVRKPPFMDNRFTPDGNVERFIDLPNSWPQMER